MYRREFFIAARVIFLISLMLPFQSFASFEDDYQTYLKTYDNYRRAYDSYVVTRSQYLTFGTLNAKSDALVSVKNFMTSRDDVLLSFIGLLRQKNMDSAFSQLLDEEQSFINTNKDKISATASLDDAVDISGELESRNLDMHITADKILGSILAKKVESQSSLCSQLLSDAGGILSSLHSLGKNTETLDRWLLDARNKQNVADQKLAQTRSQLANLHSNSLDLLSDDFSKIQFSIFESNQYLREAFNFLAEFKESIKYGNY